MKPVVRTSLMHIGILLVMFALSCIYFYPALEGKVIVQGDIHKAEAMSYETNEVYEQTGEISNWNSAMFSGMPNYQVRTKQQPSVFTPLKSLLIMRPLGLERNIGMFFLYLIGFYVALLAFGCNPWVSAIGAIGFAFGSYNIIIMEAGHIVKGWAMAMIAPILAGMFLMFTGAGEADDWRKLWKNKRVVWGFVLFTLALGLQITFNHIQITFYTIIGAFLLGISYFVYSLIQKKFPQFLVACCFLLLGCGLAFGANVRHLLVNQEYARYTMRGGNDITINSDGTPKENTSAGGLDVDYAFAWSYGRGETYTLLVPGAYGGGSNEKVGKDSESYKAFRQNRMPLYWGDQPFTSGPVYFGAIIIFLFILGMTIVPGKERWWLLAAFAVAVLFSWGRNLMWFNEFMFNHLPLYNKFRTPSMSLVLANVAACIMAALALQTVFTSQDKKRLNRSIIGAAVGTVVVILIVLLCSSTFSFSGLSDKQMASQYGKQWGQIFSVFAADRKALFVSDSWRSILFIIAAAAVLCLGVNLKTQKRWWVAALIAVLVLIDLWGVDRRYLDKENFTNSKTLQLRPSQQDKEIDALAEQYGDKDYRVLNLAVNTFNDSQPSAFHHQLGGYSAAKLRRYQDIIDFYMAGGLNMNILNMLNARYVVTRQGVQMNRTALGNAWFVDSLRYVSDANEEILALADFNPATTAIADASIWKEKTQDGSFSLDTEGTIELEHKTPYLPDHLTYRSHAATPQLAVFSEVYYAPDWVAYIDGERADYFRVDYILRAMFIPAGDHTIEFHNEAPRLHRLDSWTLVFSILLVLVLAGAIVICYMPKKK